MTTTTQRAPDEASSSSGNSKFRPSTLTWRLWYLGWRPGSLDQDPDLPVFVSVTDFHFHAPWDAPAAWRTGLRLRRSWPRVEGAIGLWLWSEPLRLRSGSVSVWRGEEDLMRFIRSAVHRRIVREYRDRMSGTSCGWTVPEFDRRAVWTQAVSQLRSDQPSGAYCDAAALTSPSDSGAR
jgi:hypothetical protein